MASYAYDAQGRRKRKTVNGLTTLFITDADNRGVLEYDGASGQVLRWYAYGAGSNDMVNRLDVVAGTRQTFILDLQGRSWQRSTPARGHSPSVGISRTVRAQVSRAPSPMRGSASTPRPTASTTRAHVRA